MKNATITPGLSGPGAPVLPDHIRIIDKETLEIRIGIELGAEIWRKITLSEVRQYLAINWEEITIRTLGTIQGHRKWIDQLAATCNNVFIAIAMQKEDQND